MRIDCEVEVVVDRSQIEKQIGQIAKGPYLDEWSCSWCRLDVCPVSTSVFCVTGTTRALSRDQEHARQITLAHLGCRTTNLLHN
jgi:hypothetical protein